mmetsp:Transcript_59431/g.116577  ORF Transcript_59431/g.116577 Transcript_59431/m.116577 type:complete len:359 (+) Transcript_59431:122-1198(+)|eukprot:CAMPEP_0171608782 /NCGR_PEP_ID=MMETSP0990-20121206/9110_1 /TAXON_ID=483369 /ORGANISM="non described non described, Strain CCMP2098" /LENGTH=358 /DNA_ID=CAMNT_0012171969 /DNA_START=100 /DNA_END=1176 /DNA_ORIENTATION=+
MLGLQASNLEQQERLYKNQIRLGLREILQQELNFYNSALHNISSVSSIFAGFSFSGMLMDPFDSRNEYAPRCLTHRESKRLASCFNFACATTTCLCLLTLVYSNFVALFSSRLALRGGDMAVELSVMRVRGEYKIVLYSLTLSAISWLMTLSLLAALKLERRDRGIVIGVAMPTACMVIYLYRRARDMFYLNKKDRFAGSTAPDRGFLAKTADVLTGGYRKGDFGGGGDGPDGGGKGGRLADLVRDVDVRNNSLGETKSPSRPGQPILDGGGGNEGATPYYLDNSRGGDNGGVGGGDSMGSAASSAASSSQREGSESNQEKGRAVAFGPKVAPLETMGPPLAGMKAKKKSMFSVNFFK